MTFCSGKPATNSYYANAASGCACFYRCAADGLPPTWGTCPAGAQFSTALQACHAADGSVGCAA